MLFRSIIPLITGQPGATSPHDAFFYYFMDRLQAVRCGRWKLHVATRQGPVCELYDLQTDIGESRNLADDHPDIVRDLRVRIDACRHDLGDAVTGIKGIHRRPVGRVDDARPLAAHDEAHPYIIAMYDLPDAG